MTASAPTLDLGRFGVWWSGSWQSESEPDLDVASVLESLGFGAIWTSGGFEAGLSPRFGRLLTSTSSIVVASGIVSIWHARPEDLVASVGDLEARHPGRFLLGIGASHGPIVEGYNRPYQHMVDYLDALETADAPETVAVIDAVDDPTTTTGPRRPVLAALGPRMLELAAQRAAGAHPYLVPVEHTARAREILGNGPILAPEVTVVLEQDRTAARNLGRSFVTGYLTLPNYVRNLGRFGFDDVDLEGGGSDKLVDAIVAWGDVDDIVMRISEHHQAGADHAALQVVSASNGFPLAQYRELAAALWGT